MGLPGFLEFKGFEIGRSLPLFFLFVIVMEVFSCQLKRGVFSVFLTSYKVKGWSSEGL